MVRHYGGYEIKDQVLQLGGGIVPGVESNGNHAGA
jgi:hypothetical protein